MATLNDLQLATLIEEIAAAMRIDAPVGDAMRRLSGRRLGSVARSARTIAGALDQGKSVADAIRLSNQPLVLQVSAAVATCEASGDPTLLLHVADQLRSRHEHSRLSQLAWLYPLLLAVVAYAVAVLVMAPMIRQNVGRNFSWDGWVVRTSRYLEHSWPIPIAIAVVVLILVLLWVLRQHRLPKSVRRFLFCQALADQLEHSVPENEAIRSAALMAGMSDLAQQSDLRVQSPEIAKWVSPPVLQIPNIDGIDTQGILVANLRHASVFHSESARQHQYLWGTFFPRLAMILIGGGLTVAYAWFVIRPIYLQVEQW